MVSVAYFVSLVCPTRRNKASVESQFSYLRLVLIPRVSSIKVLGVIVNDQVTASDHVSNILASCNSLLYALRILRSHGIPDTSQHDVFRATVITKLTYCAPSWSGACSAADRAKLESFVSRCKRLEYYSREVPTYLPMKLTILFSVESWPTMDMFYSLFCPTVIPSLTVWENDRIARHYWTKAHILLIRILLLTF